MAKELNCETLLTSYRRTLRANVHGAGNYELIDLDNNARSEATGAWVRYYGAPVVSRYLSLRGQL
jgi:hypothetical protein